MADLWIKYAEARDDTHEAGDKLLDLVESTRTDAMEIKWLWKECDDLLQAIEGFRTERDLAHQEHADSQQWIYLLEGEL